MSAAMSIEAAEESKEMLRRVVEGMNKHDQGAFEELIAPNYVNHGFLGLPPGPEGFKRAIAMFLDAFPDLHVEIEDVIAEGDKICSRGILQGTHKGMFMNVAPTGREVRVSYIDIWRAENSKFIENWVQIDMMGLLQQLGVIPSPER